MKEGHWKNTSKDKDITDDKNKKIGYSKRFNFFEGKDKKTNWIMYELRDLSTKSVMDESTSNENSNWIEQYVLCMIYEKGKKCPTNYPPSTQSIMNTGVDAIEEARESSIPQNQSKIYDKDSHCSKFTDTSIRALTKRIIERQLGSYPDQTNSLFDNRNQSKTQFDGSNSHWTSHKDINMQSTFPPIENFPPESFLPNPGPPSYINEHAGCSNSLSMSHEDLSMQPPLPTYAHRKKKLKTTLPTSEKFPPESILPTSGTPSESKVFSMPHCLSNEFSMSRDPLGNLNPPESVPPIPGPLGPPDYGFSMSHDLSGNLNPPESTLLIPGRPCNSNEFPMCGTISNDSSMSHDLSGNVNPPESTLLIPERPCYSNEFPMCGVISNEFSMFQDPSGNLSSPDGEESPLECSSQLCYGIMETYKIRWSGD